MRNKKPSWWVATGLLGLAFSIGCTSTGPRQPAATGAARAENPESTQGMMGMCPMKVPGTTASVADTGDGVAISFTTPSTGDVAELRRRVRHMAEMHDRPHGMMRGGAMAVPKEATPPPRTSGMGMSRMKMVPSTAAAEDVEGGARIVLVPRDPAQLAELRQHARDHVGQMSRGECPMMAMQGHPQPGAR
jgi:hypothetical protein